MPNNDRVMRSNRAAEIHKLIKTYNEDGMGVLHALQKDNIQNSWGARKNLKKGIGFKVEIELVLEKDFKALIFSDSGTHGLTGTKFKNLEEEAATLGIDFQNPNERLANFENHLNRGRDRDQITGGFVGQGKLVSNIHSDNYKVYYDSLREDGEYLVNNRYFNPPDLNVDHMEYKLGTVSWGKDANKELDNFSNGHLNPLNEVGTRIIIMNPNDDLIEHIRRGKMLEDIQDTWWEILRWPKVEGIFLKYDDIEIKAKCPDFFEEAIKRDDQNKSWLEHYDVRNLGLIKKATFGFWNEKLPKRYNGITIQRAQMPINQAHNLYGLTFDIKPEIPNSHKDNFYGIIILDEDAEKKIRHFEVDSHYYLKRPLTGRVGPFDNLKNTIQDEGIQKLLILTGLLSRDEDPDRVARQLTKNDRDEINELFRRNGVSAATVRPPKNDFIASVKRVRGLAEMNFLDDTIGVTFELKNKVNRTANAHIKIEVINEQNQIVETLNELDDFELNPLSKNELDEVVVNLDRNKYENGYKYKILLKAKIENKAYTANKIIYLNVLPDHEISEFSLKAEVGEWPRDTKRVNTDETLKKISCKISSNVFYDVKAILDIQLYNGNRPLNGKLFRTDEFILESGGYHEVDDINDLQINDSVTEGLGEGPINIRFNLILAEDFEDKKKGESLKSSIVKIFFNCDPPKSGIFNNISPTRMGSRSALAKVDKVDGLFELYINSEHKSFKIYSDSDNASYKVFRRDLIIRYALKTCVKYGIPQIFNGLRNFDGLDDMEAFNQLIDDRHAELLDDWLRDF